MEHLRVESPGLAIQQNRRSRVLSWLLFVASSLIIPLSPQLFSLVFYPWVGSLLNLFNLYFGPERAPGRKQERPAAIEVDRDMIAITTADERTLLRRDQIEMGWIDWFAGQHRVVMKLASSDTVWILVRDEAEARRLLQSLGLSAEQHVFLTRLVSVVEESLAFGARSALALVGGGAALLASAVAIIAISETGAPRLAAIPLALTATLLALASIARFVLPRRALVGTDGVTIKSVGAKRFIPYDDVTGVRADARGVWLDRGRSPAVLLATMPRPSPTSRVDERLAPQTTTLLARVREAMASGREGAGTSARFEVLERRGRSIADWRRDLANLVESSGGAVGYRRVPIERDDLVRIVEDGGAPPERRLGAAVALSASGDDALRGRVRIAAEACADDALRVAIERAAEGELDEEDVERAARVRIA